MSEKFLNEEVFIALDLDRCLLDTDLLVRHYSEQLIAYDPDLAGHLLEAKKKTEESGGSFDVYGYLEKEIDNTKLSELNELFVNQSGTSRFLFEGTSELLAWFQWRNIDHGILTTGSRSWQQLKIRASGLEELPMIITDEKRKGSIISSWQQADATYKVPSNFGGGVYRLIGLVDDKAISLQAMPEPSVSYLIRRSESEVLVSQQGEVSSVTVTVRHLAQVADHLMTLVSRAI